MIEIFFVATHLGSSILEQKYIPCVSRSSGTATNEGTDALKFQFSLMFSPCVGWVKSARTADEAALTEASAIPAVRSEASRRRLEMRIEADYGLYWYLGTFETV